MKNIANIREEYHIGFLNREQLKDDAIEQFKQWLNEAIASECLHPTAFNLATVDSQLRPNNRIVLLKEVNENGFVFFTNYQSQKGKELESTGFASLNFFWGELERQIRIGGMVEKLSAGLSDEYFHSRPRESQLGALVSPQSQVVHDDDALDQRYKELDLQYQGKIIPRPEHWGGYIVKADNIEFWQGRTNRMHDRYKYTRQDGSWLIQRLAP